MGYRQLQQERVQLLIGQSTLQIQEQSTLGTMQQSSLQHYSVLGRSSRSCTEMCTHSCRMYIVGAVYRKEGNHLRKITGTTRLTTLTRWGTTHTFTLGDYGRAISRF